ncbi:type I DNA topoisomerase [Litorivicinus lipolyticus]|uniref:type I DNA topoisomerase n=1 Tax=Litorivicinus lipolyticus TaxID=418701 RepID=UPI003B5AFA84
MTKLVIVESPAKAKTINKYLGKDYVVKSSVGHVRDLPTQSKKGPIDTKERARKAAYTRSLPPEEKVRYKAEQAQLKLIEKMGVDPTHDWDAHYDVIPGKEKVVSELQKLAKNADEIYLATDLDREGEAIAWHLAELLGGDPSRYHRVTFNEITKKAIQEAFKEPGKLDMDMVNAQQARRFLDRVVGFMVSPLLWEKIGRGLSAGRVQSVALRLVVEREREIRAFVPEEYWELKADLKGTIGEARFDATKDHGKALKLVNEAQTRAIMQRIKSAGALSIANREDKPTQTRPTAPFITSTLQQAASTRLGFGVKKTMMMAQRLYEAGHITYMRTDSTFLSADALAAAREFISDQFGPEYLPASPTVYGNKQNAQEAHEAIRPANVGVSSHALVGVEPDAVRLYELIWRQFVACQMVAARFTSTNVTVIADGIELKARGRVRLFDGFQRVMTPAGSKTDEPSLPDFNVGETLELQDPMLPSQHFTKPPARFSEAALVKELEKRGIGRPSTYAAIIGTIQDKGYVRVESRRFFAEKMGEIVTDRLVTCFDDLMDYEFTANMESRLDGVAQGKTGYKTVLDDFYAGFSQKLTHAQEEMLGNQATPTNISCPNCERPMLIRVATTGTFLGCSGYNAGKDEDPCKQTINLVPGDEAVAISAGVDQEEVEVQALMSKRRCGLCNAAMESFLVDTDRKLHVCGNNPDCAGFEVEQGSFKIKGYDGPSLDCDKCGSEMQLKTGRFGKFFGCTGTDCKNTRKLLKNGQPAPPKMDPVVMADLRCRKVDDHYVLRDGQTGLFLAASGFPRNRETRAPLLHEIRPVADQLPAKYDYLFKGPDKDPDGNATLVRYSRKTAEMYLGSEGAEGKPSKWKSFWNGKQWLDEASTKKAAAKA